MHEELFDRLKLSNAIMRGSIKLEDARVEEERVSLAIKLYLNKYDRLPTLKLYLVGLPLDFYARLYAFQKGWSDKAAVAWELADFLNYERWQWDGLMKKKEQKYYFKKTVVEKGYQQERDLIKFYNEYKQEETC